MWIDRKLESSALSIPTPDELSTIRRELSIGDWINWKAAFRLVIVSAIG